MKYLAYTLSGLLLLSSCGGNDKSTQNAGGSDTNSSASATGTSSAERTSLPENFYLRLTGTIKDKPIVMEITKNDSIIRGTYYYVSQGKNLDLYGTMNKKGQISMTETVQDQDTGGELKGTLSANGSFTGTWSGNGKSFPIELKETYDNGAVKAEIKVLSESAEYKKVKASVLVSYPVISTGNASAQDALNKLITQNAVLDAEEESKNASKNITPEQGVKKTLETYKETLKELADEGIEGRGVGEESIQYISLNENNVLAITEAGYMDGGGAHPNSFISYQNYNTSTGEKIKLSDILSSGYKAKLYGMGEGLFRKQNKIKGSWQEEGFTWGEDNKFYLPEDNFLIQKGGLSFIYGQYEIGAYAMGMPSVFIPYSDLKPLIKAGSVLEAFAK